MASGRIVRHYRALNFAIILIIVASTLPPSDPVADASSEEIGCRSSASGLRTPEIEPDPRLRPGYSMIFDELNDDGGVLSTNSSSLEDGSIVLSEERSGVMKNINDIHLNGIDRTGHGSDIVMDGSTVFIGYCQKSSDRLYYSLVRSTDGGESWSEPVGIHDGKYLRMGGELIIWKNQIYLFLTYLSSKVGDEPVLKVRSTSISNWGFLSYGITERYSLEGVRQMDVTGHEDGIFVGVTMEDDRECAVISYDGSSWSFEAVHDGGGYADDVAVIVEGNSLLFFYSQDDNVTSPGSDGHVYMIDHNRTNGATRDPLCIMDSRSDHMSIETVLMDTSLVLIANRKGGGEIDMVRSDDHGLNWSKEATILNRSPSEPGVNCSSYSVGTSRGTTCLAYEAPSGRSRMIYGWDGGRDWQEEKKSIALSDAPSFSPILPGNGDLMLYLVSNSTGADIMVRNTTTRACEGTVRMREVSPPALEMWMEVGLNATVPDGTSLNMRLLDGRTGDQIMPDIGFMEVSCSEGGGICGVDMDHILVLGEELGKETGSISVEFRIVGNGITSPEISSYLINYSISFPYEDDLTSMDQLLYSDTLWDGESMTLEEGVTRGTFVTDVIEKGDGPWPQLLELNVSGGGEISIGIINAITLEYVPGYEQALSGLVALDGGWFYGKWSGLYFGDMDEGIRAIMIVIELASSSQQDAPVVFGLRTDTDLPPRIMAITCETQWSVVRASNTTISLEVIDREQELDELNVEMVVSPPSEEPNSFILEHDARNEDVLSWFFEVEADAPVGTWEIRARVKDRWGQQSQEEVRYMSVLNSMPEPPEVRIVPDLPDGSDDLELEIVQPGLDRETPCSELGYVVKWFRGEEGPIDLIDPFRVSSELTKKGEDWRVEVSVRDDHDTSEPAQDKVRISNSRPAFIGGGPIEVDLDEDTKSEPLNLSYLFMDPDDDVLSYSVSGFENVGPVLAEDILKFEPVNDWSGTEVGSVIVSDGDDLLEHPIRVTVRYVEDPTEDLAILSPVDQARQMEGLNWTFVCDFKDRDLAFGQELEAVWIWNSMVIGYGRVLENISFPAGGHRVYVSVVEGEITHAITFVEFTVEPRQKDNVTIDPVSDQGNADGSGQADVHTPGDPADNIVDDDGGEGIDLMYILPLFLFLLIVMSLIYLLGLITKKRDERSGRKRVRYSPPNRRLPARGVITTRTRQLPPAPQHRRSTPEEHDGHIGMISRRPEQDEDNPPIQVEEHINLPPDNPYHGSFQEDSCTYYGPYIWPRNRFNDEEKYPANAERGREKSGLKDDRP